MAYTIETSKVANYIQGQLELSNSFTPLFFIRWGKAVALIPLSLKTDFYTNAKQASIADPNFTHYTSMS